MHALGRFGDDRWKLSLDAVGVVAYTNGWRLLLRDSVTTLPGGKDDCIRERAYFLWFSGGEAGEQATFGRAAG
jgi:hypothetical protein